MSTDDKNPQSGTDTNKKNKTPNAWGTNKKTEGGKENPNSGKPNKKFQGGTKGLEDDTFYYGPGMDNKFLHSKEKVINFIGKKFTASEKISIEMNQLILVGINKPKQYADEADLKKLHFWQQEQWRIDMKKYSECTHTVQKNLTTCYGIIWDQMTTGLQNQLKRDSRYRNIHDTQDAMSLFNLLGDVCNKSTDIDHFMTRTMDTLYGVLQLSGQHMSLGEYYKSFNAKRKTAISAGHEFYSKEMIKFTNKTIKSRNGWDDQNKTYILWKMYEDDHATECFFAGVFLRMAGERYDPVRRELKNDFTKGVDSVPITVEEAYRLLQMYQFEPKKNFQKGNGNGKKKNEDEAKDTENAKSKFPGHSFQQKDFK